MSRPPGGGPPRRRTWGSASPTRVRPSCPSWREWIALLRSRPSWGCSRGCAPDLQRAAPRPWAGVGDVVSRAVERVDDRPAAAGAGGVWALLGERPVGGKRGAQAVGDEPLAGEVDVGNRIVGVCLPAVDGQCGAHPQPAGKCRPGMVTSCWAGRRRPCSCSGPVNRARAHR
jgi:hypothetical protein